MILTTDAGRDLKWISDQQNQNLCDVNVAVGWGALEVKDAGVKERGVDCLVDQNYGNT